MNLGLSEGERQKLFLPGSKILAPLRLCAFALKMTLTKTRAVRRSSW
jgi:hypothetical protein